MNFRDSRTVEIAILVLMGCGCFLGLYLTAGGPLSWDELLYMETSWNLKEVPWILNRYAHIYFQSLFMHGIGDPIEGAKAYWSFLVSSTLIGIYLCARMSVCRAKVLTGLIAVSLFWHLRLPFRYSGTPYADFCLMFFGIWSAVFFLLASDREGKSRRILLILFGLFLLMSIKSKEHGIVFWILLLGLGRTGPAFDWRTFKGDLLYVFIGCFSGVLLIGLADTLLLHKPFYSLWPGNVESVLEYNVGSFEERPPDSWLGILTAQTLAFPFILFLFAPFVASIQDLRTRIVWTIPLLFVLFLTVTLVFVRYRVSDRQLIASLPFLCVGGALFFQSFITRPSSEEGRIPSLLFLLSGIPALLAVALKIPEWVALSGGWTSFPLESAVIYPGGALLLLLIAAWFRDRPPHSVVFLVGFVFWLTLLPGVKGNLSNLYHDTAGQSSRHRFLPFERFEDRIPTEGEPRFLVSPTLHDSLGMLGRSAESCSMMFDLYFKTDTVPEQFAYRSLIGDSSPSCDYDAVFLTQEEFDRLPMDTCGYTIFKAEESGLIFLLNLEP